MNARPCRYRRRSPQPHPVFQPTEPAVAKDTELGPGSPLPTEAAGNATAEPAPSSRRANAAALHANNAAGALSPPWPRFADTSVCTSETTPERAAVITGVTTDAGALALLPTDVDAAVAGCSLLRRGTALAALCAPEPPAREPAPDVAAERPSRALARFGPWDLAADFSGEEPELAFAVDPESANATGSFAIAEPTPSATANAPTRPTKRP